MKQTSASFRIILALAVGAIVACEHLTTLPVPSPTTGHDRVAASDSSGSTVPGGGTANPTPPTTDTAIAGLPQGPGKIHGQVLGSAPITSGQDSMSAMPKLANISVEMYPCLKEFCAGDSFGPQAASFVTDANGKFASPTLPGGYYTVVFTPPSGSAYRGVYAWFYMNPHSDDYQWWVVLSKK